MGIFEYDDLIDKEYMQKQQLSKSEIDEIITNLQIYSEIPEMLTKEYTKVLLDDNVMYILTKISQNPIFKKHFPEFYLKNMYGESVINCQQNTVYHRYGVFKHILCTVESVGKDNLKFNARELKILKWTMLLHDIGKPMSKSSNGQGVDSFVGHDELSVAMAENILNRFYFTESEKKVILTLIKYHDKFLNEGDLTYDNLSFLAKELDDKKDLFYMLVEVKNADNKAKSIDVYNKFINAKNKYFDFMSEYFIGSEDKELYFSSENKKEFSEDTEDEEYVYKDDHTNKEISAEYEAGGSGKDITEKIIVGLCKDVTSGKRLKCYYQPIIDLKNRMVEGYEIFYKVLTDEDFSYKQIIRKAKEFEKYDKLQQMLFVNGLNDFKALHPAGTLTEYINIDVKSYKNYVNKSRIFDAVAGRKVVIEFNNFESLSHNVFKEIVAELNKVKAKVAIDNFESTNKSIKEIEKIEPKVIKYKIEKIDENVKKEIQELLAFCISRTIRLVCFGIDTKEKLNFVMSMGVRYVQGEYFSKPIEDLTMTKSKVEQLIDNVQDDNIF